MDGVGKRVIKEFLQTLYARNRLLTVVGWLHLFAFGMTLIMMMIDDQQVLGINAWVKPAKFMFSLTIYIWTIAWLSEYVGKPRWRIRTISVVITIVIIIETACLLIQAARGTSSHFNISTDFDAAIFSIMGVMIGIDMLMGMFLVLMYTNPDPRPERTYLWGIRTGLLVFLIGGAIGVVMIVNNAHTFGAPDGGPGMPFTNWSTVAGDMRIAHGLGLHALQIMPIAGFLIGRSNRIANKAGKLAAFSIFAVFYCLIVYGAFAQALAGIPLIPVS